MSQKTRDRIRQTFWKISKIKNLTYRKLQQYFPLPDITVPIIQSTKIPQYPLILLHGYMNSFTVWDQFVSYFNQNGYILHNNIFLFDGRGPNNSPAIIDIRINAQKLKDFVKQIKEQTGSSKVDLVGHSMGGLISRWYIEQMDGAKNINKLIMLGTPNRGSDYLPIFSQIIESVDSALDKANREIKELHDKSNIKIASMNNKLQQITKKTSKLQPKFQTIADSTIKMLNKQIQKLTSDKDMDHLGIAAVQMTPGSEFLTTLGYEALPNYYLIFGTQGLPQKFLPKGENDGCVHEKNAKLNGMLETHMQGFKLNHSQLHSKTVVFNKIMEYLYSDL